MQVLSCFQAIEQLGVDGGMKGDLKRADLGFNPERVEIAGTVGGAQRDADRLDDIANDFAGGREPEPDDVAASAGFVQRHVLERGVRHLFGHRAIGADDLQFGQRAGELPCDAFAKRRPVRVVDLVNHFSWQ
jgi:hypothetical protein